MGNRPSNSKHRAKDQANVQKSKSNNEINLQPNQHAEHPVQSNRNTDENIYATARSGDDTSEYSSSIVVSSVPSSDVSAHGIQHIIQESVNNYHINGSTNTHLGTHNIHCYGTVSFVNTDQSNIQINNQQHIPMVHDFGNFDFLPISVTKEKHRTEPIYLIL